MGMVRTIQCSVDSIIAYGRLVKKIILRCLNPFPRFKEGQYIQLAIDAYRSSGGFWPESRAFSIALVGADRRTLEIVYKQNGDFTRRMAREMVVGSSVWLKGPYGDFSVQKWWEHAPVVLVAGGTGISPFVTFLSLGVQGVRLYYGLERIDYDPYREVIVNAARNGHVELRLEVGGDKGHYGGAHVDTGQLDFDSIIGANEKQVPVYLVSGPPGMLESFKERAAVAGIEEERVITDDWS